MDDHFEAAYEIAKLHAATDGAFDERLTRHWFEAAWQLCCEAIGLVYPARQVNEIAPVNPDGTVSLTGKPTSDVKLYSNGALVAVLPPNAPTLTGHRNLPNPYAHNSDWSWQLRCSPSLCCYCYLQAVYDVGQRIDPCRDQFSPSFVQAVARLFAYMVENRGDVKIDDQVLTNSGAKGFLAPHMTYIA
jgi:hypothetical protein